MKYMLLVAVGLTVSSLSFGQAKIKRVFFSKALNDSIRCNIWLPKDWNVNGKYPSVYLNAYGALGGGNGMLVAANINNFVNNLPPSVVVDITSGQMDKMDYSYETAEIGKTGKLFIECLKTELIPQVETEYRTTNFRAFIGQSYSSSYANYLFLHQPGLFNAYILFTPEKISKDKPSFEISNSLIAYYKTHPTFYYLAPAGQDVERRQAYAKEIQQKIKAIDSVNFHFKYELFPNAGHNDIVSYALLRGLNFVYSLSSFGFQKTEANIVQRFDSTKNTIKNIYGIEFKKNSMVQVPLLNTIVDQKDEKAMDYFASFFDDSSSPQNPLMLFNTACTYDENFNDVKKAKTYLLKSINDARNRNNKSASDNAFRYLAKNIYWKREKNKTAAWKTLKEGFEYTKYYAYKYIGAQISVESKSNLDEGIENLLEFVKNRKNEAPDMFYSISNAYLLLAKCHYYKNDKTAAKIYLDKALNEDPKNEDAKSWEAEVKI